MSQNPNYAPTIRQQCVLTFSPNLPEESWLKVCKIFELLFSAAKTADKTDKFGLSRCSINIATGAQEIYFRHPSPIVVQNTAIMFLISERQRLAKLDPPQVLSTNVSMEISSSVSTDMELARRLFTIARAEKIIANIEAQIKEAEDKAESEKAEKEAEALAAKAIESNSEVKVEVKAE